MALPKISAPLFTVELPSSKRKVDYRPFTVKEEKLLLMASESDDAEQVNKAIKQILTNCFIEDIDVDELPIVDVEYIFLKLRATSVENLVTLKVKDDDDGKYYEIEYDLNEAVVVFDPNHTNRISLNDEVTLTMKYPSFKMIDKMSNTKNDVVNIVSLCIDKVVDGEDIMDLGDFSEKEVMEFIESFTSKNMRDIEVFFNTLPSLRAMVNYITPNGAKTKEVVGLQSFFTS
tara:strand:+ start:14243 stop:14935 length:693 start_codon:yes stop_codon:yes gene_type:complete